jgi:hypothetical protein
MAHRKDRDEDWAIALLQQIVDRDRADRDAISGQAMHHIKEAQHILLKRRSRARKLQPDPLQDH